MKRKLIATSLTLGFILPLLTLNSATAIKAEINKRTDNISAENSLLLAKQSQPKWAYVGTANNAAEKYRQKHNVPGMSVAIAKNGKIIYANGFGWKNVEKKIKASKLTRYRLASVSKPVTAILAMEMREKGQPGKKLLLNQNIRTYLPKLPSQHNYRVRDLLAHQSGVRHYKSGKDATRNVNKHFVRSQDAMNLFIKDKLIAQPRTKYSYSTHGYTVLAAAIENISGKTFFSSKFLGLKPRL